MNGAEAIAKCLQQEGVEVIFGYPGVAICPFFDAIYDTDIRTVLIRQEQNAAHAASGYARVSGRTGVAAVTSGPGATNLITGIATAFADSIPLVCFTGQVDSRLMGSDVFQEADISGACESFVKYSYIVRDANDIPRIIKEAFYIASTGRKGPVLIDLPFDVQMQAVAKFSYPESITMRTYKPTVRGHAVQIAKVVRELGKAKRPIICAGGGVHLSGASDEVRAFAEKHGIPVVSTMMGLGVLPTEHPLFYGMVGNNGHKSGNRAINESDMILMVGARVADRSIRHPDEVTEGKALVHIDVDPAEIGKNAGPTIPLVGDIRNVFRDLLKSELSADYDGWLSLLDGYRRECLDAKHADAMPERVGVDPQLFVRTLSGAMKKDAVYVADVGQNQLWSCANCVIREGRFLTSGGMGTMGYALPAAMGAKAAAPRRQVVSVSGDGGFQMNMCELSTMHQYGIQCKAVVLRNNTLGLVRQFQHRALKDRFIVVDLDSTPDLEKLSGAYEMHYYRIGDKASMEENIAAFLADPVSSIPEVIVDPGDLS